MKTNNTKSIRNNSVRIIFRLLTIIAIFFATVSCTKMDKEILSDDILNSKGGEWKVCIDATKKENSTKSSSMNAVSNITINEDGWEDEDPTKALYMPNWMELKTYWSDIEKVDIYKGNTKLGVLSVSGGGGTSAKLVGTINGTFSVGEKIQLYFIGKDRNYDGQKGTIDDIAKRFDYASAEVEVEKIDTQNKVISFSSANFQSLQSINNFSFDYSGAYSNKIKKLTITAIGLLGESVTIIPDSPTTEFYVALSNPLNEKVRYDFTAELENGDIITRSKRANLQDGKYYYAFINNFLAADHEPLTFELLADGTITIQNPRSITIYYNINSSDPSNSLYSTSSSANPIVIDAHKGDKVQFYGDQWYNGYGAQGLNLQKEQSTVFNCDVKHYIYGNITSLLYLSGWWDSTLSSKVPPRAFLNLFHGNKNFLNHPVKKILMPAKSIEYASYRSMFEGCISMKEPPKMFVTELIDNDNMLAMFAYCHSLQYAPSLPATTLTPGCYQAMFLNCFSLESSPELPAKVVEEYSYHYMFYGCSNLKQITCYATTFKYRSLQDWVSNVASAGIFIKDEETSWASGNSGIPTGWSNEEPLTIEAIGSGNIFISNPQQLPIQYSKSISMSSSTTSTSVTITIPVVPGDKIRLWGSSSTYGQEFAIYNIINGDTEHYVYGNIYSLIDKGNYPNITSVGNYAFRGLFMYNTHLKFHPTLKLKMAATSVGDFAYNSMFEGCSGITTAPDLPATNLGVESYSGMFDGCTSLESAPALPATNLAEWCYSGMFARCTSLESAPALPATNLAEGCYGNMFDYCLSLQTAPELPASTLVPYCYMYMFRDCEKLKSVKCLATNIQAEDCVIDWLENVSPTGTFTKKNGVTWPTGASGIPTGWTIITQ